MKQTFSNILFNLAEQDDGVVVLLNDVTFPKCEEFKERFPNRIFNFGLTECATVGIAAGMASEGLKPIMYTIAPFLLERALEFVKIDVDANNLPVILVGYDYEDYYGPTHTCMNAKDMVDMFKNIRGYFPENNAQATIALKSACHRTSPSFILLKKSQS